MSARYVQQFVVRRGATFMSIGARGRVAFGPLVQAATFNSFAAAMHTAARLGAGAEAAVIPPAESPVRSATLRLVQRQAQTVCRDRCPACGAAMNRLTSLREGVEVPAVTAHGRRTRTRLVGVTALTCSACDHAEVLQ